MPDRTLIERLDALSRVRFEGEAFRHMGPGYGPLDAEGARIHGGRWNPPNSFPVLYFALGRDTAGAEFRPHLLVEREHELVLRRLLPASRALSRSR